MSNDNPQPQLPQQTALQELLGQPFYIQVENDTLAIAVDPMFRFIAFSHNRRKSKKDKNWKIYGSGYIPYNIAHLFAGQLAEMYPEIQNAKQGKTPAGFEAWEPEGVSTANILSTRTLITKQVLTMSWHGAADVLTWEVRSPETLEIDHIDFKQGKLSMTGLIGGRMAGIAAVNLNNLIMEIESERAALMMRKPADDKSKYQ